VVRGEFVASPRVSDLALRYFAQRAQVNGDAAGGGLSVRERQIARLLELGYANKEIAARLGIEVATVKNHVHRLLRKLNVRRRGEAVAKWRCCGRVGSSRWEARNSG
jgi:DNA-binding CsgD family transcriptional regulator